MFRPDHVMIETADPEGACARFRERFDLPLAWPWTPGTDYDSVGVGLGGLNVEFIRFRTRFGEPVSGAREGLGGLAFEVVGSWDDALSGLERRNVPHFVGEDISAHTTVPLGGDRHAVVPFLVRYKFDTSGWRARLDREFAACGGGRFGLRPGPRCVLGRAFEAWRSLFPALGFDPDLEGLRIEFGATAPDPDVGRSFGFMGVEFALAPA
jgi:hypothetical protein